MRSARASMREWLTQTDPTLAEIHGGKLPHGYRREAKTGLVEIDPDAAAEVRRIFELVRAGSTIRATAETMTAETGRPWARNVVDRIVRREVYKHTEPRRIIDARVWNARWRRWRRGDAQPRPPSAPTKTSSRSSLSGGMSVLKPPEPN
jgi:hypothetical protein